MSSLNIGIVAVETWAGGRMYTSNLIKALSHLPIDEKPNITFFYEADFASIEDIYPCVTASVTYRPWNKPGKKSTVIALWEKSWHRAAGYLMGESSLELALAARRAGIDALYPVMYGKSALCPQPIAWIPDFQHRGLPDLFSQSDWQKRDRLCKRLLSQDKAVVFSSEHAYKEAQRYYGKLRAQTHILHFTSVPDISWYQDTAPIIEKYKLPNEYVIVCNQFWVHKDHATLFNAIALLKEQGNPIHLVCTGLMKDHRNPYLFDQLTKQIKALGINTFVHVLGMLPRLDQILLMRGARVVVQPSLYEGWSTVLEDSRALGKTVVASDFPVHLEQAIPGAIYFRSGNSQECAQAIEASLHLPFLDIPRGSHEKTVLTFARDFMHIVEKTIGNA